MRSFQRKRRRIATERTLEKVSPGFAGLTGAVVCVHPLFFCIHACIVHTLHVEKKRMRRKRDSFYLSFSCPSLVSPVSAESASLYTKSLASFHACRVRREKTARGEESSRSAPTSVYTSSLSPEKRISSSLSLNLPPRGREPARKVGRTRGRTRTASKKTHVCI